MTAGTGTHNPKALQAICSGPNNKVGPFLLEQFADKVDPITTHFTGHREITETIPVHETSRMLPVQNASNTLI